jgi:hypothetical protein
MWSKKLALSFKSEFFNLMFEAKSPLFIFFEK